MSNYTPGPWGIVKDKRNINYGDIESCYNGALVCIMPEIDSGLEDELISEADARLIAAAPELVDKFREALRIITTQTPQHKINEFLKGAAELLRRIKGEEDHND